MTDNEHLPPILVNDARVFFQTLHDDREGGIVTVTLIDPNNQPILDLHTFPEYPEWKQNRSSEAIAPVSRQLTLDDLRVRVSLTEANEVNISWTFEANIELRDAAGSVLSRFARRGFLNTTGKGFPRTDTTVIDRTPTLTKWRVTARGRCSNGQTLTVTETAYLKEEARKMAELALYHLAGQLYISVIAGTETYEYAEILA